MDHYCPWIGNCVGYANYKYFYLLLVYVGVGGVYYIYSALNYLWLQRDFVSPQHKLTIVKGFVIFTGNICILPTIIAVIYLSLFHTYLIYNNLTTIESLYNFYTVVPIFSFLCCDKRLCRCFRKRRKQLEQNVNPYDMGFMNNFQQVLGKELWMWFLPINAGSMKGGGIFFPRIPEFTVIDLNQRYETVKGDLNRMNGSYSVLDVQSKSEDQITRQIDQYLFKAKKKYGNMILMYDGQQFDLTEKRGGDQSKILGDLYREQQEEQQRLEQEMKIQQNQDEFDKQI